MGLVERKELYESNDRIKEYTDKFMQTHGIIEVESALQCMAVKNFIDYVEGGER